MDQKHQQSANNNDESRTEEKRKSNRSPPYALFNLLVIIVAIIYATYYQIYLKDSESTDQSIDADVKDEFGIRMFTADELKAYNGEGDSKQIYLAILGDIFDVTRGEKHYGPGAAYHDYVGKDASKAFITGEFDTKNGKSNALDHVLSLSPSELVSLKKWRDFYIENYVFVGRLIGRFYEADGTATEYFWSIDRKIQFGLKQLEEEANFQREFPPCNMEFKREKGTRFWCTTQSGGIERELAGWPIQLFNQDTKTFSCVCTEKENFDLPQFRKYESCDDKIRSCFVSIESNEDD